MGSSTRGVLTAALSAVLAAAAWWHWPLVGLIALLVVLLASGWPRLVALPVTVGPGIVIAVCGLASLAVVELTGSVNGVAAVVGLAVAVAFVQEMLRRDGRPRLVESVAGTVTGSVIAASAALAAGAACTALPVRPQIVATLATLVAGGAGLVAGYLLEPVGLVIGGIMGLVAGVLTAAIHLLFGRFPAATRPLPALAAAALPPMLAGAPTFMLGSVLLA